MSLQRLLSLKNVLSLISLWLAATATHAADYAISGRVTEFGTDTPVAGADVILLEAGWDVVSHAQTQTDADGNYTLASFCGPQPCYVYASKPGYATENTLLPADPPASQQIALQLARPNTISGTVSSAAGALAGITLRNYRFDIGFNEFRQVSQAQSDAAGHYTLDNLRHGRYRVCAEPQTGSQLLSQCYAYHDQPAIAADQQYTEVVLGSNEQRSDIHFDLHAGRNIAGTVRDPDSGWGVMASVTIYDGNSGVVATYPTTFQGEYRSSGLPPGTYRAIATTRYDASALYGGIPCNPGCMIEAGTPIELDASQDAEHIDFAIPARARISGVVRDAQSGQPVADVLVSTVSPFGPFPILIQARSRADGSYTLPMPPDRSLRIHADGGGEYVSLVWPDTPCPEHCMFSGGTPVSVPLNGSTAGIDFALNRGGSISGQIAGAAGAPYSGATVMSLFSASNGAFVWSISAASTGSYETPRIAPGSYFLRIADALGGGCEVYDGVPCPASGALPAGITPISVGAGATVPDIDFRLDADAIFSDGFDA
jgi:Carboxypeptidase regulatory-like domain